METSILCGHSFQDLVIGATPEIRCIGSVRVPRVPFPVAPHVQGQALDLEPDRTAQSEKVVEWNEVGEREVRVDRFTRPQQACKGALAGRQVTVKSLLGRELPWDRHLDVERWKTLDENIGTANIHLPPGLWLGPI